MKITKHMKLGFKSEKKWTSFLFNRYWQAGPSSQLGPHVNETEQSNGAEIDVGTAELADGGFSGNFTDTTRIFMTFRTDWAT